MQILSLEPITDAPFAHFSAHPSRVASGRDLIRMSCVYHRCPHNLFSANKSPLHAHSFNRHKVHDLAGSTENYVMNLMMFNVRSNLDGGKFFETPLFQDF
jgi:hypothetical protein